MMDLTKLAICMIQLAPWDIIDDLSGWQLDRPRIRVNGLCATAAGLSLSGGVSAPIDCAISDRLTDYTPIIAGLMYLDLRYKDAFTTPAFDYDPTSIERHLQAVLTAGYRAEREAARHRGTADPIKGYPQLIRGDIAIRGGYHVVLAVNERTGELITYAADNGAILREFRFADETALFADMDAKQAELGAYIRAMDTAAELYRAACKDRYSARILTDWINDEVPLMTAADRDLWAQRKRGVYRLNPAEFDEYLHDKAANGDVSARFVINHKSLA